MLLIVLSPIVTYSYRPILTLSFSNHVALIITLKYKRIIAKPHCCYNEDISAPTETRRITTSSVENVDSVIHVL